VKRVLITGAGGFLGGAIRERLVGRGDVEVIATARADLADRARAEAALASAGPDVVVHAAGRTHGSVDAFYADNVATTETLAAAITAAAPGCGLILLGSAAQYGRSAERTPWRESGPCEPLDDYGTSKLVAEAAAFAQGAQSGLRVASLRIFNVIAPAPTGEQAFSSFLRKLARAVAGPPPWRVEMGSLAAIRDFVAVEDVLEAVERVIDRGVWSEPINVCTGVGRQVRELLEEVSRQLPVGSVEIEEDGAPSSLDWSVGDPSLCETRLGFRPSSDLTSLVQQAGAWVRRTAKASADA
jgi:GDP-4-dehydro-6-deoxy-D-mannose reductase